jgi:hypothetical protein
MRPNTRHAFTLYESIITLSIVALVMSGLLLFFVTLAKNTIPRQVAGLRIAPNLGVLRDAALLNQTFGQRVGEGKAVYVFGGTHRGISTNVVEAQVRPLSTTTLPAISSFSSGLPSGSYAFYQLYSSSLGSQEGTSDASDYTVIVVGPSPAPLGRLQITCMLQVRHAAFTAEGSNWFQYTVTLTDLNQSSTYTYAVSADQDSGLSLPVGAIHTWHRFLAGVVAEEGPTVCVVPDPHLMGGHLVGPTLATGESEAVSRFVYFLE